MLRSAKQEEVAQTIPEEEIPQKEDERGFGFRKCLFRMVAARVGFLMFVSAAVRYSC